MVRDSVNGRWRRPVGCLWLWLSLLLLGTAGGAAAAELDVAVVDAQGRTVADAVVTLVPLDGLVPPPPRAAAARKVIDQQALAFVPALEVLRPGDEVVFRNSDRTRHHVYSFSPVKAFEFVLAPDEVSPPQRLARTGVVAVGCNIHDQMIAHLYVTDAPWVERSTADGHARFAALPEGAYEVHAWHPRLRPGRAEPRLRTRVAGPAAVPLRFPLVLLPGRSDPAREHGHY